MKKFLDFEYYPKIKANLIKESKSIILSNKDKWDPPFFTDTESYLDLGEIQQVANDFLGDEIKNVIVLIQKLLVQIQFNHLKQKIFSLSQNVAMEHQYN